MKKHILLIVLSLITITSFSQKIKFKNNIAFVNRTPYFKWEKQVMEKEISIFGIRMGEEDIFVTYQDYVDANKVTNSNTEGKVRWIEINFLTLNKKCEISSRGHKGIVKMLYANKIYVNGVLNTKNVTKMVMKYGLKISDNRREGNVKVIINN